MITALEIAFALTCLLLFVVMLGPPRAKIDWGVVLATFGTIYGVVRLVQIFAW